MANTPTPEEAVERARRAQDERIEAVRVLAQARHDLSAEREHGERELASLQAQLKDRLREFELVDVKAFNAATAAGWSADELRRIGFAEPEKKRRARRTKRATTELQRTAADEEPSGGSEGGHEGA